MRPDEAAVDLSLFRGAAGSAAGRLREVLNLSVLCVVATLVLCAATMSLVLYEGWIALNGRGRRPARRRVPDLRERH